MTESSALFRACKERDTWTARTLLNQGAIDLSAQMNQLNLDGNMLALFVEYGHRIPSGSDIYS